MELNQRAPDYGVNRPHPRLVVDCTAVRGQTTEGSKALLFDSRANASFQQIDIDLQKAVSMR